MLNGEISLPLASPAPITTLSVEEHVTFGRIFVHGPIEEVAEYCKLKILPDLSHLNQYHQVDHPQP